MRTCRGRRRSRPRDCPFACSSALPARRKQIAKRFEPTQLGDRGFTEDRRVHAAWTLGSEPDAAAARSPEAAASAAHGTWVEYPFPLRDEVLLRLSLPADLSVDEAERLAGFVRSLGRGGR